MVRANRKGSPGVVGVGRVELHPELVGASLGKYARTR